MNDQPILSVRELHIHFRARRSVVKAVNGVDFDLAPGQRLAIVGESGSGKSVMSASLLNLLPRTAIVPSGRVELRGRDVLKLSEQALRQVRGREIALISQDPSSSLNPVVRIGKQIMDPARRHLGLNEDAARDRAMRHLREVGIPDPERAMRAYPHELSGGMRQRALIATALACEPSIIVADEPTTALDVTVQAQIIRLLTELSEEKGTAMILVTHDLGIVARFAQRVAVMYAGRFVEFGDVDQVFGESQHPYTIGLLQSIPRPDEGRVDMLHQINGVPPDPSALPPGCPFWPRCPHRIERCMSEDPPVTDRNVGHVARCWVEEPRLRQLESLEATP